MLWTLRFVQKCFQFGSILEWMLWMALLRSCQRISIWLRSRLWLGRSRKHIFFLLKPLCCSFNSLLWVVVQLHHQNFCWTSIGGKTGRKMPWQSRELLSHSALRMMLHCLCVFCSNRTCIIVRFLINTQKSHSLLFPAVVHQPNKSHNVGQHQRC